MPGGDPEDRYPEGIRRIGARRGSGGSVPGGDPEDPGSTKPLTRTGYGQGVLCTQEGISSPRDTIKGSAAAIPFPHRRP